MRRSKHIAALMLIAVMALSLPGCGSIRNLFGGGDDKAHAASFAEFGNANTIFTADSAQYAAMRATMRAKRIARQVSDDKWLDFRISQGIIQSAAPVVEADLAAWGATGKKPEMYDAHSKTLRDALAEVALIAKEFE